MLSTPKLPEEVTAVPPSTPQRGAPFYMALIAILISLVGTSVSVFEAKILQEQQAIMSEEKEASVWPYLSQSGNINMTAEGTFFSLNLTNEGVGPALLGDISHAVGETSGGILSVLSVLKDKYPQMIFALKKSFNGKKKVIGEGETVNIYELLIINGGDLTLQAQVIDDIKFTYCYCSIYGDCWSSDGERLAETQSCSGRDYLR